MPRNECIAGIIAADSTNHGGVFDLEALNDNATTLHDKTKTAAALLRNEKLLSADNALQGTIHPYINKFTELTKIPVEEVGLFVIKPSEVLGEGVTKSIKDLYDSFKAAYPEGTLGDWKRETKSTLEQMQLEEMARVKGYQKQFVFEYFNELIDGSTAFGYERYTNPFAKIAGNVVGNLVKNNPAIAMYNLFEIAPKGLAYAVQNGDPAAFFRAIKKTAEMIKVQRQGKFGLNIRSPELEAKGVYGDEQNFGIINLTEDPLRTVFYYLGEELHGAEGANKAIEELAYVYQFGNMPKMLWRSTDRNTLALMRYSVGMLTFFGKMAKTGFEAARAGDYKTATNAAMAFMAFEATQMLMTGTASAVPAPVDMFLPTDVKQEFFESLKEFDEQIPFLNMARHVGFSKIGEQLRPLGIPTLGVAYSLVEQDLTQLQRGVRAGIEGISEADLAKATLGFAASAMYGLQLGKVTGVDYTTARIVSTLLEAAKGEIDWEDVHLEALKRLKIYDSDG